MPARPRTIAGFVAVLLSWSSPSSSAELRLVRAVDGPALQFGAGSRLRLPVTNPRDLGLSVDSSGRYWIAATEEVGGGVRLRLFSGDAGQRESAPPSAVPNPSGDATLLQLSPIWLDAPRQPVLVWLEGHDIQRLAVRAATWTGRGWVHPRLIAPPGPGSQLALTGAVHQGKPVVAWAAYDGKDDEILWSRWDGRRWTRAQRLVSDNRVPDVTPSLTVASGRLLASWARFDGDTYRVVVSSYDGQQWAAPRNLGMGASSAPHFVDAAGGLVLFARRTPPGSLLAYEMDSRGEWSGRSASMVDPDDLRLVPSRVDLVVADGQGVELIDERGRPHELRWEAEPNSPR